MLLNSRIMFTLLQYSIALDISDINVKINRHAINYIKFENDMLQKTILRKCDLLLQNISKLIDDIENDRAHLDSIIQRKKDSIFVKKTKIEIANQRINDDCVSSCGKGKFHLAISSLVEKTQGNFGPKWRML